MKFLENIKQVIAQLANSRGISIGKMQDDWGLDYTRDMDVDFTTDIIELMELMRVHQEAIAKGDLLTARCALVEAQGFAHNISSLFYALKQDLLRAAEDGPNRTGMKNLDWPELPDRFEYSPTYRLREAEKLVSFNGKMYKRDTTCHEWRECQ